MLFAVIGDPLAIFIGAMPVVVVAAFSALYRCNSGPHRTVLMSTLLAVFLSKILLVANSLTDGFELYHFEMKFVPYADLGKNLGMATCYFFTLFGCDFFGKDLLASPTNGPSP